MNDITNTDLEELKSYCGFEITDGNVDDPEFAYCGHTPNHGGDHGHWLF